MVLAAVAYHLAAPGEEHEIGGAVPVFDHVQPLVDLATQRLTVQVTAQKDGLDGLSELRQRPEVGCCTFCRVKRRRMASGSAVPRRSAVVYLWSAHETEKIVR